MSTFNKLGPGCCCVSGFPCAPCTLDPSFTYDSHYSYPNACGGANIVDVNSLIHTATKPSWIPASTGFPLFPAVATTSNYWEMATRIERGDYMCIGGGGYYRIVMYCATVFSTAQLYHYIEYYPNATDPSNFRGGSTVKTGTTCSPFNIIFETGTVWVTH